MKQRQQEAHASTVRRGDPVCYCRHSNAQLCTVLRSHASESASTAPQGRQHEPTTVQYLGKAYVQDGRGGAAQTERNRGETSSECAGAVICCEMRCWEGANPE